MKKFLIPIIVAFIVFMSLDVFTTKSETILKNSQNTNPNVEQLNKKSEKLSLIKDYGYTPLYFIPNKGQVDKTALFYSRAQTYTLWITKKGLVFDKVHLVKAETDSEEKSENRKFTRDVSQLNFINANKDVQIVSEDFTEHRVNYFRGDDKSKWYSNIETSKQVIYKNLYDGIDLKIYGIEKQIEYDWIVHAGANPKEISFKYENVKSAKIDKIGNLVVTTGLGELVHKKPISYQMIKGKKVEINVTFKKTSNNVFKFNIENYNPKFDLVIDPLILDYSTYLGGASYDSGRAIVVDSSGSAYITGSTSSTYFPTTDGSYDRGHNISGQTDVFVTKFAPTGNFLVYSTFIGGEAADIAYSIDIDSTGCAYVTGYTMSSDYPTVNPYQGNHKGYTDAFVTKLSSDGDYLIYSTYLGGDLIDTAYSVNVDSTGAAYIAGATESSNFPIQNAYQSTHAGSYDIFVTQLKPSGSALHFSTFIGGTESEVAYGAKLANGNLYLTGIVNSSDFPTVNPYQGNFNGGIQDAFVIKMSSQGSSLLFSTFLGGNDIEAGKSIAVDSSGACYVTGNTESPDFPTTINAFQTNLSGWNNAFITKLTSSGDSLIYSTYLGGISADVGNSIDVDSNGSAYVTGDTGSNDFPLANPFQDTFSGNHSDVFVTKISPSGDSLLYSTYLAGNYDDLGMCIAVDSSGSAYITGYTHSSDYPISIQAYQGSKAGISDVFLTKLTWQTPITAPVAIIDADRFGGIAPLTIEFDGSRSYDPDGMIMSYSWNFGTGDKSTGPIVKYTYDKPGTYTAILSVRDDAGNYSSAKATIVVFTEEEIKNLLTVTMSVVPKKIKANGKGSAILKALCIYTGSQLDMFNMGPILINFGLNFTVSSGRLVGNAAFNTTTGLYSQQLISGKQGTAKIISQIDGITLYEDNIEFIWPQPPSNVRFKLDEERSLFRGRYKATVTWEINSEDIFTTAKYRVYRSTDGSEYQLVGEIDADSYEFIEENLDVTSNYRYAVSSVDTEGDESLVAEGEQL